MDLNNLYQAEGLLQTLYDLGPSPCFLPTMISYYKVLLMTERGESAMETLEYIYNVLKDDLHVTVEECRRLAKKFHKDEEYLLSILFDLICILLCADITDCEKLLLSASKSMSRLRESITKAANLYSCNETLKTYVVPKLASSLSPIFENVTGKSKKTLAIVQVACQHNLEQIQRAVADLDGEEATLRESLEILRSVLGEEAKEIHLFGTVLNNLASTVLQKGNIQEAKDLFLQAIEINENAQDYSSEEERGTDIYRSQLGLKQAEEILSTTSSI